MDSLNKLEEMINSFPPNYDLLKKTIINQVNIAKAEFEDFKSRSITWGISDFAKRARQLKGDSWKNFFNEVLFEQQLLLMIKNHDGNDGISWSTIDFYLYQCLK